MRLKDIFAKVVNNKFVQKIKEKTIDPVRRSYLTWRMLEACDLSIFEDVPELLEKGADLHASHDMALAQASRGCLSLVKLLVEKGADVRSAGDRPLRTAASHGQLSIVKYLHEKGADLNVANGEALMFAARHGHPSVVHYLVENGVTINSVEDWPYRSAVNNNHEDVVHYFDRVLERQSLANGQTQKPRVPKP